MAFDVILKVNSSPVEKIGKTLSEGLSFSCTLKGDTSILKPTVILASPASVSGYNYMQIPEFNRSYFIDDIVSVRNGVWEISGHVDVLETYKDAILANSAVIKRQTGMYNLYLDDPEFKTYAYEQIQTKKFPANGFLKTLNYVLTINGS